MHQKITQILLAIFHHDKDSIGFLALLSFDKPMNKNLKVTEPRFDALTLP
jgi:hypothetical protein